MVFYTIDCSLACPALGGFLQVFSALWALPGWHGTRGGRKWERLVMNSMSQMVENDHFVIQKSKIVGFETICIVGVSHTMRGNGS